MYHLEDEDDDGDSLAHPEFDIHMNRVLDRIFDISTHVFNPGWKPVGEAKLLATIAEMEMLWGDIIGATRFSQQIDAFLSVYYKLKRGSDGESVD